MATFPELKERIQAMRQTDPHLRVIFEDRPDGTAVIVSPGPGPYQEVNDLVAPDPLAALERALDFAEGTGEAAPYRQAVEDARERLEVATASLDALDRDHHARIEALVTAYHTAQAAALEQREAARRDLRAANEAYRAASGSQVAGP